MFGIEKVRWCCSLCEPMA